MERILIIDNYDSFTYNLVHYVEANPNFEVVVFRNDEISLDEINQFNTIILSPGPGLPGFRPACGSSLHEPVVGPGLWASLALREPGERGIR